MLRCQNLNYHTDVPSQIPEYLPSGDYSLRVEGRVSGLSTGLLFFNESRVEFDSKQVSIFIQTHRSFLRKGRQGNAKYLISQTDKSVVWY